MDFDGAYSDSYQPTVGYGASVTPHPDSAAARGSDRASRNLYKAGGRDDDDRRDERRDSRRSDRRDRSPARREDRDRDRSRDRDRDRRDSRRDRDSERDSRRDRDYEPPFHKTVHVKGLPMLSGIDGIRETMKSVEMYVGEPKDIQMLRIDRNATDTRPGAWIEMPTAETARMLLSYGTLVVDGVTVDLSAPVRPLTKEDLRRDWICMKCGAMNFSRRMECFQCNASREGNAQPVDESGPRGPAAGLNNDNVVIVRDLSEYVEEDTLRRTFQSYGGLKEVRMVRDKYTQLGKGFAFIEFDRHQEALHVVEESNHRGVYVENSRVKCALARGKDAPPKGGNQAVASAAIEAAMALNSSRMGGGKASSSGRRRDEEREDPQSVYGQPPAEGFELDPATGYFYNQETQQYYESATSLYYTFKDGQCYYFDNTTQNYAACIGIGNPSAPRVGTNTERHYAFV